MPKIYLLAGVPASGKSWVCSKLHDTYTVVQHDDYMKGGYLEAIKAATAGPKPVLCETPFSVSQLQEPLLQAGHEVEVVFVYAPEAELLLRYESRGRSMPKGAEARQATYRARQELLKSFGGTSTEVLEYLKGKA